MGFNSTQLHLFGQQSTGQLLFESFESPSWLTDEGWNILQGAPTATDTFAFDGQWSLQLDATYPIIQYQTAVTFGQGTSYFYDDATQTATTLLPFSIWSNGTTNPYVNGCGIGVDCSVNTGTYSYFLPGGVHKDSGIARTSGFHRFGVVAASGGGYNLQIDGNTIANTLSSGLTVLNVLTLGVIGSTGAPIFGYWDDVQLAVSTGITVQGMASGCNAIIYDEDWNEFGSTNSSSPTVISLGSSGNYPINGRIMITQNDGVTPAFYSAFQNFWGGDVWALAIYDFGRRPTSLDVTPTPERTDVYSPSGQRQSTFFYSLEKIKMQMNDLTTGQRDAWIGYFSAIAQGTQFGLAIYSHKVFLSALTNGANVPASFGLYQAQFISVVGLGVGSKVVLISSTGQGREVHKITAVNPSTGVVTFAEPILNNFSDGDTVRALWYWPTARTTDKAAGIKMAQSRSTVRWNVSMMMEESLP